MEEDLEELMQEPPGGGVNHGRKRSDGDWRPLDGVWDDDRGDWVPLLLEDAGLVSVKQYAVDSWSTTDRHGTVYAYVKLACRCSICKGAMSAWKRQRRLSNH